MEENKKLNILIGLMIVVFLMQLFLKPSVHIEDNHLGIQYEIEQLREQFNSTLEKSCNEESLKIELDKAKESIKNLNNEIQIQKIMYEEIQVPFLLIRFGGESALEDYQQYLEEKYS